MAKGKIKLYELPTLLDLPTGRGGDAIPVRVMERGEPIYGATDLLALTRGADPITLEAVVKSVRIRWDIITIEVRR